MQDYIVPPLSELRDPFLPDPTWVRVREREISRRLAGSIAELARAAGKVVEINEETLVTCCNALRSGLPVRSGVYLLYYDALMAAQRDDAEALKMLLEEMTTIELSGPPFVSRNVGDASLPTAEWARYQRALLADPDNTTAIVSVAPALYAAACHRLQDARRALDMADPALAGEIGELVREVVFAQEPPEATRGFGGATSFQAWGTVFLNAARLPTLVSMVDGLVHEAAHALLFALSLGEPMVGNSPGERYPSPLRTDRRPMDGIFHATFVSARMCYAMDRLLAAELLDPAQRAEAAAARDAACRAFDAGHAVVREHARPTSVGLRAMAGAAAYVRTRTVPDR